MTDILIEYGVYVVLGIGMVCANLFGKPKTAEQLAKRKLKLQEKLRKKSKKLVTKLNNVLSKLGELGNVGLSSIINNEKKDGE